MKDNHDPSTQVLASVRQEIERDHTGASNRLKVAIGIQAFLILFVAGYMTWMFGSLKKLDAATLTNVAAVEVEGRLPELRASVRDYALEMAPELTDGARDLLLDVPARLRANLEEQVVAQTDMLVYDFERELDALLTEMLTSQIEQMQAAAPNASPEEQLDSLVVDVSGLFRETMKEAIDEVYIDYADEIAKLNDHLEYLRAGRGLTEAEKIDKQLIETWLVLVETVDTEELLAAL